jgi:hypothetical protein
MKSYMLGLVLLSVTIFSFSTGEARTLKTTKASCLALTVIQAGTETILGNDVSLKKVEFFLGSKREIRHLRVVGSDKKNDEILYTWIFENVEQVKFDRCGNFPGFEFSVKIMEEKDFLPLPEIK